jgi:transcriptional antiterminator NusG
MSPSKRYDTNKLWYAIHTYSGYEEKVAEAIRQRAASLDMKDKIFQVLVPKEKMIEIKNGKRRVVEKRIFQGYVLVQMKMGEDAWYIVRNTPSVTGFVGSGTEPTPISKEEIEKIQKRMGLEQPKHKIDYTLGEVVNIIDGPFKGFDGSVSEIDAQKGKLKVLVNMFGRETPVELDSLQVKRV